MAEQLPSPESFITDISQQPTQSNAPSAPVQPLHQPAPAVQPQPVPQPQPVQQAQPQTPPDPIQQPVQPPAVDPNSLRGVATARGLDASQFQDDQALATYLLNEHDQLAANQPFIDLGRQTASGMGSEGAGVAADTGASESDGAAGGGDEDALPPEMDWVIPEVDSQYQKYVEQGPDGSWQPIGNAVQFAPYAKAMNDRDNAVQQRAEQLVHEFPSLVKQASARDIASVRAEMAELKKAVESGEANRVQSQQDQEAQEFIGEREAVIFQHDAAGNRVINPQTGEPTLTGPGQALLEHAQSASSTLQMTDPAAIRKYAWDMVEADHARGRFGAVQSGNGQQPGQPQAQPQTVYQPQPQIPVPPMATAPGVAPTLQPMAPAQPLWQQPPSYPAPMSQQPQSLIQPRPTFLDEGVQQMMRTPNYGGTLPTDGNSPPQGVHQSAEEIGLQICREAGDFIP